MLNSYKILPAFLLLINLMLPNVAKGQNLVKGNLSYSDGQKQENSEGKEVKAAEHSWQSAILRADGFMDVEGVEAYSYRTICGNEDIVLVKFVNKNDFMIIILF